MAIAFDRKLFETTAAGNITVASVSLTAGEFMVLWVACDTVGTSISEPTITDVAFNGTSQTFTVVVAHNAATSSAGSATRGFIIVVPSVSTTSTSTININFDIAPSKAVAIGAVFTGVAVPLSLSSSDNVADPTFGVGASVSAGDLCLAETDCEENAALGADTDTSFGTWTEPGGDGAVFTTGGGAASNVSMVVGYKIATANSSQLWTAASGVGNQGGASFVALGPGSSALDIAPSGLASAEAFGTAVVTTGPVDVAPSGVGSAEAFGSATVTNPPPTQDITPSGVATAEAFGSSTVTTGAVDIAPAGLSSAEVFGSTTVSPGPVDVSPSGVASAEAFGTAVLRVVQSVLPSAVGSAESFGSATLTTGPADVTPSGLGSGEAFGTALVSAGGAFIVPTGISSAEAVGTATVAPGAADVAPTGIASAEVLGSATVTPGAADVSPTGLASGETFGSATVSTGPLAISTTGIDTSEVFGTATVAAGGPPPQAITVTGIPAPDADELAALGFNGDFETTITPWYAAGPAGGTVTRDTTESVTGSTASLKLVHGSLGGEWSEAGNDDAFANGAGAKRISFWMKSSQAQDVIQVWPFFGNAPLDWSEWTTLSFSVTTSWQFYEAEFDQTAPMFTGLYFDQFAGHGAVPGTTLWVDDILVDGIPLLTTHNDVAPTGIVAPGDEPGVSELGSEWNTTLDVDLAQWGTTGGTIARITTGQYEGAGAVELTHGAGVQSVAWLYHQRITPVTAGPNRLIVAMRADTERTVQVDLFDSTYTEDHLQQFVVGTGWAEYEFDIDLASGDVIEADFTQFTALGATEGSKLYIDSLELRPLTAFGQATLTTGPVDVAAFGIPSEETFTRRTRVHRVHRRILRAPSVQENLLDLGGHPQPWSVDQGITLLKIDGVYHQVRWPTDADIASATAVYRGGFDIEVDDTELADLTAAGYGAYIQLVLA